MTIAERLEQKGILIGEQRGIHIGIEKGIRNVALTCFLKT